MYVTTKPGQTFTIVLETDKHKPEKERPCFEFRYLSSRDWQQVLEDEGMESPLTDAQTTKTNFELLSFFLVGWDNMRDPATGKKIPFDSQKINQIVTPDEADELMCKFSEKIVGTSIPQLVE